MKRPLFACLLALTAASADDALVKSDFIYETAPFPSCHASTIVETPAGLVVAFFGGTKEKHRDVSIWVSRQENGKWTAPMEAANGDQPPQPDGKPLRHPLWNPVLFQPAKGPLMLFYKCGPDPDAWWGMLTTSKDNGKTWSKATPLPDKGAGPVKNKPVLLPNGDLLCGSSSEDHGWRVHFERTSDLGKTWTTTGPVNDGKAIGAIQPSILFTGGEKLGPDLIEWGKAALGITLSEVFGQTEGNLVIGNSPKLFPIRVGSMGRALPGHEVEIVDETGRVLPPNTPGIVGLKRPDPVLLLEYWKRPEATAAKFAGEWCLYGDRATKDEDGYFWFQGRNDDIIKSSGYRIGPTEVEDCLVQHPAVRLAGVIGTPDSVRGEAVTAFIVLAEGHTGSDALAAEIQAFVRTRLAAHEYPRKIRFIADMPMTVTGKIRRLDLRALDEGTKA